MRIAISALALLPAVALGASALDGSWKLRVGSMKATGRPDSRLIINGTYSCASCVPAIDGVPADGAYHRVAGHAYYDEIRVTIRGPSEIEITTQRDGRRVASTSYTVSADGHTCTGRFTDYTGSAPATGSFTAKRVGHAPAGAHAASGSWLLQGLTEVNEAASVYTYLMTADGFTMKSNGQSYEAKFDGRQYPIVGDPGGTRVLLKKIDDHTVHETDYRQGKLVDEVRLSASGNTLKMIERNVAHGQTMTMTFDRLP
jgi:hypothetical protein